MCKRRNESSQIKREDYEKQLEENMSANNGFLYERATKDQLYNRHIVRASRGRNRDQVQVGNYSVRDH
eukprot:CAMPEP_0203699202 /NCGR_PEP_ID=MMETSP0091-20130426/25469_1 /ASSEMBLY_ACC=CAM_ASM_001089 /TAXON_ID=426623 /ORGANISM="Chaetoceros affinis, Strain CCMP159" /LENGTH=67 /DNA_ID=CAMNT_0050571931 /DNA_START=36 /DNA_END=242 /DNA_ORIENTATION=+